MEFIQEGIDDNQNQRNQKPSFADCSTRRRAKCACCQEAEDGVLREVRNFSRDEVDYRESFRACVWKQPENQRSNDPRGVVG